MRNDKIFLKSIIIILIGIIFVTFSCRKQNKIKVTEKGKVATADVQQFRLDGQPELESNINTLLKIIREKEEALNKTELELKRKSEELAEKEKQLQQLEAKLKRFRRSSYFILILGLVLVGIRLISFFNKFKSKGNSVNSSTKIKE